MQMGRCLCGSLVFKVTAKPKDIVCCYCDLCQRASGSAYLVETLFRKRDFRQVEGEPAVYEHKSEDAGKLISLYFCKFCGTKTHMHFDRFPDIVGIFSGTFDVSDWFARTHETALHLFLSTAPKGTVLPAGFQVYDENYWKSECVSDTPQDFKEYKIVYDDLRPKCIARLPTQS
jgi:hypothetical protein